MRWRNCCVRGSRGAPKISAGVPSSRITPASRKQTRLRDVAREAHLVRRDEHRHSLRGELADDSEHLGDELGVERARDLVEQEQSGLHGERAHDRDALLLSAREPIRVLVAFVGEAETGEQLVGAGLGRHRGEPERLPWRERDVVEDGHVREEIERLEDDPDPAAQLVHVDSACRDVLTTHGDASRVDRLEQVDAAQER